MSVRLDFLIDEDRRAWEKKCDELTRRNIQGTKLRVHTLNPEFLDDPVVRVGWSRGEYKDTNAFHSVMAADPDVPERYVQDALKVLQDGTSIPNTLSNHAIVVFGPPHDRRLLMCHRRKDDRPGSYSRNRWSVSFEEQYNPITQNIGDEELVRDSSILGSVERGVREELLGDQYSETISISIHCFQLETMILNFGFLAVVELPDVEFDVVKQLWPGARDAGEHDALVALPVREGFLRQCLASPRLPESLFPELQTSCGFEALGADDHLWHPTSPVRIALALWLSGQA